MSRKRVSTSSASGAFLEDLPAMQFGFGDVAPDEQDPKTTEALDDILCDWLRFVGSEATAVGDGVKITVEDVMFVVRKDKKKHDRIRELVAKAKQIERDQKIFRQDF